MPFSGDVDGALEPGGTRRLAPAGEEEEPFKRRELPLEREQPSYTGGEYGGGYGPAAGEGGAGGDGGYSEPPPSTQTKTLASYDYARSLFAPQPTTAYVSPQVREAFTPEQQTAIRIPTSLLFGSSAPAPAPSQPTGGQLGVQ